MTINSHGGVLSRYSPVPVDQRLSVLNAIPHPALVHPSHPSLPSPRHEPIAGPSGLPPVQQVPLVIVLLYFHLKHNSNNQIPPDEWTGWLGH